VIPFALGLVALVFFVRSGRIVPAALAMTGFSVATWFEPVMLFAAVAAAALTGLLCAAPRWAGEAPGPAVGAARGFAAALLIGLPPAVTAAGTLFATWQLSR